MVKHLIHMTVKYGEFDTFRQAIEEYQKASADLGLEPYRLWCNNRAGVTNEVWLEAHFATHEDLQTRDEADDLHAERFKPILLRMLGHVSPGSMVDRRLDALG